MFVLHFVSFVRPTQGWMAAWNTAILIKASPPLASLPCSHTDYVFILATSFPQSLALCTQSTLFLLIFTCTIRKVSRGCEKVMFSSSRWILWVFFWNEEKWNCPGVILSGELLTPWNPWWAQTSSWAPRPPVSPTEYGCFWFIVVLLLFCCFFLFLK